MKLVECQHEWVKHCRLRYRCDPPVGYWFENAHYPLSEKMGGTETIPLWYPDHIVQGVLQTIEYSYPCIFTRNVEEPRILSKVYPEYAYLYQQAAHLCKSYAGKLGAMAGFASEEYMLSPDYKEVRKRGGSKAFEEKLGAFSSEGVRRRLKVRSNPVAITTVQGTFNFESLTAAAQHFKVNRSTISRWKSLPSRLRGIISVSDTPK